ncbi:MAG: LysR substrate-binding domain-containing protein [Pseudomonadota bacterium]
MRFRSYDALRAFTIVARHDSFSAAAADLHLTKGAISHQMRLLERDLGFALFVRRPRGIALTARGEQVLATAQSAFELVEDRIEEVRRLDSRTLTIGVTTYFASRWLSPRLMDFMREHPDIRLRVQPMIDLMNWKTEGIDLAIRWGNGSWSDAAIEKLFVCPAWPSGNAAALRRIEDVGLTAAFEGFKLLRDRDDSTAWTQWYERAGLPYRHRADTLIIPDPNVRVQAVIDGQGVALNDALIGAEVEAGRLFRLSPVELADFGYFLAYPPGSMSNPDVADFAAWLRGSAG